jgi:hypothetical protein
VFPASAQHLDERIWPSRSAAPTSAKNAARRFKWSKTMKPCIRKRLPTINARLCGPGAASL